MGYKGTMMNEERKMDVKVTETRLIAIADPRRGGYKVKSRIYIWPEGETILENFNNRRSRPLGIYREAAFNALDKLEVDRSRLEIKWSQKAGCSCGCSPGFVVDGWTEKLSGNDLHVTITCE